MDSPTYRTHVERPRTLPPRGWHLARAIEGAVAAGRWDIVARLARELEAWRLAHVGWSSLREMPEVTDWSKARRNPYVRGRRSRILDADLVKAFPDSTSVNAALREVLAVRVVVRPKRGRAA
jgi:hypothetical protein